MMVFYNILDFQKNRFYYSSTIFCRVANNQAKATGVKPFLIVRTHHQRSSAVI